MNTNKGNRRHSLAPWAGVVLSIFCSVVLAEHGGRDRTERDDHLTESHSHTEHMHSRDEDRDASRESNARERDGGGHSDNDNDSEKDSKTRDRSEGSARETNTVIAETNERRIRSEMDFEGHERRSGEVILTGRDEHIVAIQQAGYKVISTQPLNSLSEVIARIHVRSGESVDQALQTLHSIAPDADIAANHLFRPSQQPTVVTDGSSNTPKNTLRMATTTSSQLIGLIDTGADNSQEVLKAAIVDTRGLTESGYVARDHGTIVSQIACTEGAQLAVADVFGVDKNNQLVAPAEAIARGIDWLLSKHVMLINVSIEGPDNVVLSHVIRRAIDKGAIIIAAAGNSGPAASPSFPAAYPGVIAVTAVDENNNVYPRANRGDYITFAARGVRIRFRDGAKQGIVSGTSFAAPVVTAEIARRMSETNDSFSAIVEAMKHDAVDLGPAGRDTIYGWGLVTLQKTSSTN